MREGTQVHTTLTDPHTQNGSELEAVNAVSEVQLSTSGRLGLLASRWLVTQTEQAHICLQRPRRLLRAEPL